MCDADVDGVILDVRLAIVVMAKVHLLFEHYVQKSPHGKLLLAQRFAFYVRDFFQFVGRDACKCPKLSLGFGDLPDAQSQVIVVVKLFL